MVNFLVQITKAYKRFYLYLLKELTYILLLSLAILTFILVMSRLGKLTDLVINKGVGLMDIVLLIVYSSPPYLTFTLPMAFLLSTIVTWEVTEMKYWRSRQGGQPEVLVPIASVGTSSVLWLFLTQLSVTNKRQSFS